MTNIIYTITRNKTNKTVYATDNYSDYVMFIKNHFPITSYEYNNELNSIELKSNNFTFTMIRMNNEE